MWIVRRELRPAQCLHLVAKRARKVRNRGVRARWLMWFSLWLTMSTSDDEGCPHWTIFVPDTASSYGMEHWFWSVFWSRTQVCYLVSLPNHPPCSRPRSVLRSVEHWCPTSLCQQYLLDESLGGRLSWEDSGGLTVISFHRRSNTILRVKMKTGWDMGSTCELEG